MGRVREVFAAMGREMRKNKGSFAVYVVLRLIVLACAVGSLAFDNYEAFFLCLLTLVLFLVPTFIEVNFSISIPETLEVVIALFIFAAEILGELLHFYTIFPFWDALLHTFNGFLAAAIGLALVSILNRSDRIAFSLSPFFCVVVAFCFSMTIGVLWEFFEFGMDEMFGLDMQKDTVVTSISSTLLDPTGSQRPERIDGIQTVEVNGQELEAATGSSLQLWMPETVARYFTRDIVNIELTQEDAEPDVQQVDPCYRNKINIMNYSDDCVFKAGDEITFEGVADDLGSPIAAIEFSFDNGRTWTSCDTDGATADKWVNWQFTTSFEEKGDYRMTVRAKTADGMVSPLAATLLFEVA